MSGVVHIEFHHQNQKTYIDKELITYFVHWFKSLHFPLFHSFFYSFFLYLFFLTFSILLFLIYLNGPFCPPAPLPVCTRTSPFFMDTIQTVLAALVAGLVIFVVVFYFQGPGAPGKPRSKFHRPTFLMVGPTGAGKTSLFFALTKKKTVPTVSSLEPNVTSIGLPFSNEAIQSQYQLIDYPGHLKYSQLLRKLIVDEITVPKLKGVIYVVDSSSSNMSNDENVSAMARDLFQLLSLTEKVPNGVDFMFAVNKQDLFDSRPVAKIRTALEAALGQVIAGEIGLRGQNRGASGIDNDDSDEPDSVQESTRDFWRSVVGSRPFHFDILEGNMEFVGGSVVKNRVSAWENWFDEKAVNYGGM